MASIRFSFKRLLTPPRVPIPDQFWISAKCIRRRELFRFEFAPKSGLRVTKSREPAFGGDSGAGKSNDSLSIAQ